MSDREAFVAAIAANPADDLPRLVFADWLEEHGDPERAEFIHTQIRWHHADGEERKRLNARAADLFRDHWMRWFGPFLRVLEPKSDPVRWYEVRQDLVSFEGSNWHVGHAGSQIWLSTHSDPNTPNRPAVSSLTVRRGFAEGLGIQIERWESPASLVELFQHEPVSRLDCRNGLHSPHWLRFTDPVLRRVERITMYQTWTWHVSAPESTAFLDDPHLAGVRHFGLMSFVDDFSPGIGFISVAWLERFVRSSLAYRLTGLWLPCINSDGLRSLCRPGRLRLERLELGGQLTPDCVRRLGASDLANTMRELELGSSELGNTGAAALARDEWRKLTRLGLTHTGLTASVLPALAAAEFTPRLVKLDLSGNPLFTGNVVESDGLIYPSEDRDVDRLRPLAEALDPERLERLDLTDTGLSHVPDFLAERFGNRVVV